MDKSKEFKYTLSSAAVELSEHNTYLLLKNEICFYNEPNLNGTGLKYDDMSLDKAKTLIDMPVYAKYKKIEGKDDFGGHEAKYDSKTKSMKFGTVPIGVHTAVEIKEKPADVNGETKTVPCLFATMKIWTRNRNAVNAIKRLYDEGRLVTSFESIAYKYHFDNGVKWLDDYEFEGNAMLGTKTLPAYTNARAELMECASAEDPEMIIAEALAADFSEKGQEEMAEDQKKTEAVENTEEDENIATTPTDDNTDTDKPTEDKETKTPDEPTGEGDGAQEGQESDIQSDDGTQSELDNSEQEQPEEGMDGGKTTETDDDGSEEDEIAKLTEALAKATARIAALEAMIDELSEVKSKYDAIESEREEAEKAETRKTLTALVESSKMFTEEELSDETSEIAQKIKEADTKGVNALIASRYIEQLEQKTTTATSEVAEKKESKKSTHRDTSSVGYDDFTGKDIIGAFVRAKKKTH